MSEPSVELRRIDWKSILPFTLIFRVFKMAYHPSALGLAFLLVLVVGVWGYLLDGIWSRASRPVAGELAAYSQVDDISEWRKLALMQQSYQLVSLLEQVDIDLTGEEVEREVRAFQARPKSRVDWWLPKLNTKYNKQIGAIEKDYDREDKTDKAIAAEHRAKAAVGALYNETYREIEALKPRGIFASFLSYEQDVAALAIEATLDLNFAGGFSQVLDREAVEADEVGVLGCVILAARGKMWLFSEHPFFAILFGLPALAAWALLGGAICRISALYAARDERVPMKSALAFAQQKFLSFLVVPLIPSAFIAALCLLLSLLGVLGSIPILGDIVMLIATPIGLSVGVLVAIVVVGLLAGGFMFYSAIAAEGSDGFDALSRSFSFVYTKPWNTALYAIIAAVYGAICYVFVRFFVFVVLVGARAGLGFGMAWTDRPGIGLTDGTKIDAIWTAPTFDSLFIAPPALGSYWGERWIAQPLVLLFVMLVILKLCAFLVSFFYSGATVIYLLLRRDVDGIDLDDVYLEDGDGEIGYFDAAALNQAATSAPPAVPAEPTSVEPAPVEPAPEPTPVEPPDTERAAEDEDATPEPTDAPASDKKPPRKKKKSTRKDPFSEGLDTDEKD